MKASDEILKKPRIDVRHHIDHSGLRAALGYVFTVDGNEDGTGSLTRRAPSRAMDAGGAGEGGVGDSSSSDSGTSSDGGGFGNDDPSGQGSISPPGTEGLSVSPSDFGDDDPSGQGSISPPSDSTSSPTAPIDPNTGFQAPASPEEAPSEALDGGSDSIPGEGDLGGGDLNETPMPPMPFDFETRALDFQRRAKLAGATRSTNMADLLGYTPTRKARGEARRMLGTR